MSGGSIILFGNVHDVTVTLLMFFPDRLETAALFFANKDSEPNLRRSFVDEGHLTVSRPLRASAGSAFRYHIEDHLAMSVPPEN